MINFTRSFSLAWERMVAILFQPFDLGKYFTIGFSAFLAGLLAGGNGFNGSYNQNSFNPSKWNTSYGYTYSSNFNSFNHNFNSTLTSIQTGASIFIIIFIAIIALLFIVLLYWLGSRGQFLLLDNVVRNRGVIAWPWHAYSRQANSVFGFFIALFFITMLIFIPVALVDFFSALPFIRQHRWPEGGELFLGVLMAAGTFFVMVAMVIVNFLFRELSIPLMFRHGVLAGTALSQTWQLVSRYPGAIALFLLLRFALAIALAILSVCACCCFCLGIIPYIGTLMILPALIYIKCFTLDVLAQFGPEYDVWTVDVPAASPPPPLG